MSPAVSLPVSFSSRRREEGEGGRRGKKKKGKFLGVTTTGFGRGREGGGDGGGEGEGEMAIDDVERAVNVLRIPSSSHHTGTGGSTDVTNSPTDSFPYSISDVHFRNSGVSVPEMDVLDEEDGGQLGSSGHLRSGDRHRHHHRRHHHQPLPHPPLPSSLTPQRFSPSLSQQSQQSTQPVPSHPSLRSLTPQRFDPYLPQHQQSHSSPPTLPPAQEDRERAQSFTSSIFQRVFGTR
jgi:hypothetical protein